MTSGELEAGTKSDVQTTECISLTISTDPSVESGKGIPIAAEQTTDIKCDTLRTTESDLNSVLKELASSATTTHNPSTDVLSHSGQMLNSSDAIGTLNHHASSFNASVTGRGFHVTL